MSNSKLFFALAFAIGALAGQAHSALAAESGGPVLRIPFPKTTLTLDPGRMEDWYSMAVILQIHRGLFRYQPGGDVEPDLVDSWKEEAGGLTYRFKLGDHRFSDGTPVKASHVVHTLARLFHISSSMAADLSYIKGSAEFAKSKKLADLGLKALDDRTVEVSLERKSGLLFKHLAVADCSVVKLDRFDAEPAFDAKLATNGPYKVVEQSESRVVLEKWRPDRRDSANPPRRIEFQTTETAPPDAARSGKVDSLDFVALEPKEREALASLGWEQRVSAAMWEHFLILNPARLSLDERHQVQAAIDQDALAKKLADGTYAPAYGLIPTGLPGALTAANWKDVLASHAKDKTRVAKEIVVEHNQRQKPLAAQVVDMLKARGFKARTAEIPTIAGYIEKLNKRDYAVVVGSRGLDYPDGYSVLAYFRKGYEGNYYHVEDPVVDKALDAMAQLTSADGRAKAYHELSVEILKRGTIAPLVFGNSFSGYWGPKVKAVPAHPMGFHHLPLETVEMQP